MPSTTYLKQDLSIYSILDCSYFSLDSPFNISLMSQEFITVKIVQKCFILIEIWYQQ
jgi:hypothetical protein